MSIISLIPARGGSKGIHRKNIAILNGKPLISYSINSAFKSRFIDKVIVSTDDNEIAEISKSLGAEVPFLRPSYLSEDKTPILDVINHFLDWLDNNSIKAEAIVLLQPTSPLRNKKHIDEAIKLFREKSASSVVSVIKVPHQFCPYSVMKLNSDNTLNHFINEKQTFFRRQDKPLFLARNGPSVLITRPDNIRSKNLYGDPCYPYLMDEEFSIDIDTYADLLLAETKLINMSKK